jgi:hypothetical protein
MPTWSVTDLPSSASEGLTQTQVAERAGVTKGRGRAPLGFVGGVGQVTRAGRVTFIGSSPHRHCPILHQYKRKGHCER